MSRLFDSFRIGRFRGFTDVEFSGCGATNLLIGVNNSGKSSVLEALALYCRPFDMREWLAVLNRREARSGRGASFDDLTWLFGRRVPSISDFQMSLSGSGDHPVEVFEARAKIVHRFRPSKPQGLLYIPTGEEGVTAEQGISVRVDVESARTPLASHSEQLDFWPGGIFEGTDDSPLHREVRSLTPFSHRIEPMQLKSLSEATKEGWKDQVLELLRQIDPAILDL